MNRDLYIEQVLREHLTTPSYLQLTSENALTEINNTKQLLLNAFNTHKNLLSQPGITYFTRSFKENHCVPIFYGMPKVHKNPMKLQPVVSCINSLPSIFSTWLDFKMKELLSFIPSYIKNSTELIKDLKQLHLPPGAKVFTADAISMYTNIDTETGIQALRDLLTTHALHISPTFLTDFFLLTLEIIMNHNIFSFGDSFWQQLQGTAMGTPAAPLYSILTYGQHENINILHNLLYYKRYVDDIFGILVETTEYTWEAFKLSLNQFGTLQWNTESLTTSTTFLDLHIQIDNNRIITKTLRKGLNLYLYIPPISAHPASCFKGLITGEIIHYWTQNS